MKSDVVSQMKSSQSPDDRVKNGAQGTEFYRRKLQIIVQERGALVKQT